MKRPLINSMLFLTLLGVLLTSFTLKKGKTPNIILMIGDGMGLAQICAGMVSNGGYLNLMRMKFIGLSKTSSADDYITDSAAGATAIACGKKTYNKAIGVGPDSVAVTSILEYAEAHGLATGLVVTCPITHATPACFIAHQSSRSMDESIAADFLKTDFDVFIGGGKRYFEKRSDGRNLVNELRAKGYFVQTDTAASLSGLTGNKVAWFTSDKNPKAIYEGRDTTYLRTATMAAVNVLQANRKGFFLMVEGSQIDWGGHENNLKYVMTEMVDFDRTLGAVLDFAEKDGNTLVIVTADHETGGLSLIEGTSYATRQVNGKFSTKDHSGIMVPVFAFGPGADRFTGIYENTELFNKMMACYGFRP